MRRSIPGGLRQHLARAVLAALLAGLAMIAAAGPESPGDPAGRSPRTLPHPAETPIAVEPALLENGTSPHPQTAGAPPLGSRRYPIPPGARFVSPHGHDDREGTREAPWRTIAHAVSHSPGGTTIVLLGGIYPESVQVYDKALTIQPYPGDVVWLSGSDVVTRWTSDDQGWRSEGYGASPDRADAETNTLVDPAHPLAGWPEMVFIDGRSLRQVATQAEIAPATFYVDVDARRVHIGTDPAGHVVEVATRPWALYLNGADDTVVRGIGIRHYATPVADMAAIRAYGDRIVVEDTTLRGNAFGGLSVIGRDVVVRNNTVVGNGQLGIHGHHADGLLAEGNALDGNNRERFDAWVAAGGIKVTSSRGIRLLGNRLRDNAGPGLWIDMSSYGIAMVDNWVQRSARSGIQLELSSRAVLAGNVVTDSGENGIWVLESNDVEIWNNTLLRNHRGISVLDGDRASRDVASPNHDRRFPVPSPSISWDVERVRIRNNVLVDGRPGAPSLLGVDDTTHRRSASAMHVTSDHNAFHRASASSPAWIVNWADWPTDMKTAGSLREAQVATGQELHSVSGLGMTNPFVSDEEAGDYRIAPASAARLAGAPLPSGVARALGRTPGQSVDMGTLRRPVSR